MTVEETIKTLRSISQDFENGNDGTNFDICGECKNAADQLERLNDFQNSQCMKLMEKIAVLESENEQLKVENPVRCGECVFYGTTKCALDELYENNAYSFCSFGKRRDAE